MKNIFQILLIFLLTTNGLKALTSDNHNLFLQFYSTNEGLSSTKITGVVQDGKGFMWIGTEDGLNKFDGYQFTVYKNKSNDSLSLISNHITSLFCDSNDRLWVGTIAGLQCYDPIMDNFINVDLNQPDYVIKKNQCQTIFEDSKGNLWFAISGLGVLRYSPATDHSLLFSPSHTNPETNLCCSYIRSITEDKEGKIWFGSQENGISVYTPGTNAFKNYTSDNSQLVSDAIFDIDLLANGDVLISTIGGGTTIFDFKTKTFKSFQDVFNTVPTRSIFCSKEDKDGNLLIGTEGKGLMIFNPKTKTLTQHPVFREHTQDIGDSKVHCIFEDNQGFLWVAMNYKGLCVIKNEYYGFKNYIRVNNDNNSLSYDHVMSVTTDLQNNIWIATDGGGLNRYNSTAGRYTHYRYDPHNPSTISDDAVVSVLCDSKNRIWAGTYTGGLCLFDRATGTFTRYMATGKKNSLHSNFIKNIVEDKNGCLWLGTSGGGLSKFDPERKTFQTFRSDENRGLASDYIVVLFTDSKNRLWVGTYFGLSCMNIETGAFISFTTKDGLSNSAIYSINEDEEGTIWIGTQNGLNKFNPTKNTFTPIFTGPETYSSVINGIIPHEKRLWLSTNNGILHFNPEDGYTKLYGQPYGIHTNEFILASYYKSPANEIYFGGISGFVAFHPDEIRHLQSHPPVYITGLRILNQRVGINREVNGRIILSQNITETDKITLQQSDKSFTLEFTSPDTPEPLLLTYACKLEGFNNEWIEYDPTRRFVTYTNLDPGIYTFKVKATNDPEVWGEEYTSLIIEIVPPIWRTWWMKLIYTLVCLFIFYLVLHTIFIRLKEKNELRIEKLKTKQQEELNLVRSGFYTNISHEFRTPLTLIITPLEEWLISESDPERKQTGEIMLRNARRLLHLINQLMDLNKMEEGKVKLRAQELDLFTFISNTVSSFNDLARQKQIAFSYEWNAEPMKVWYDPDMMEKSLNNILSNAFKFTPEGGHIEVRVTQDTDESLHLSIKDSGIGLSEEALQHVFDRFYRGNRKVMGTGVGLHLTKGIVELHKGEIWVESKEGEGCTFHIQIILGEDHLAEEEKVREKYNASDMPTGLPSAVADDAKQTSIEEENDTSTSERKQDNRPTLLLIEDNKDMRQYIRQELEKKYDVEEASNGKIGLSKARKLLPDLIITDVKMPEMSGIELCRVLKTTPETSHIPIIILTAQNELKHKMEGLETGADSYISKPFHTNHLKIRIEKLIEIRRNMKERFSKSLNMEAQEMSLTSTDERLLQNAINYVRENIENTDMSVETMSKTLGLSRTHLHRKLKALTGQSPVEFIKTIRMKQAAYLLSTGKLSVSEVGYKVGYNTPSYFSSSFNAHFGMSPTAYMEKALQEKKEQKENENTNT